MPIRRSVHREPLWRGHMPTSRPRHGHERRAELFVLMSTGLLGAKDWRSLRRRGRVLCDKVAVCEWWRLCEQRRRLHVSLSGGSLGGRELSNGASRLQLA